MSTRDDNPKQSRRQRSRSAASSAQALLERIRDVTAHGRRGLEELAQRVMERALGRSGYDQTFQAAPAPAPEPEPEPEPEPAPAPAPEGPAGPVAIVLDSIPPPPAEPELADELDKELPQLPAQYGEDRLTLLARDPGSLHCSWELTAAASPTDDADAGVLALRLLAGHGGDEQAPGALEEVALFYPVGSTEPSRRLAVDGPQTDYAVELGQRSASGQFTARLRSDRVTLPRATPRVSGELVLATPRPTADAIPTAGGQRRDPRPTSPSGSSPWSWR